MIGRPLLTTGAIGTVAATLGGARRHRQRDFTAVNTAGIALVPTPIDPAWLMDDDMAITQAAEIARTDDGTTAVYLWETTRAHYRWEHASDETITVLEGEVFIRDENARVLPERRLGPGDVAFFPAGARTVWRVPDRLRKVSTLTRPLPSPLASTMRGLRAIKRLLPRRTPTGARVPARSVSIASPS